MTQPDPAPDEPKYLSVAQVAKRLNKHPETIRRWARTGVLPALKLGREFLISETTITA